MPFCRSACRRRSSAIPACLCAFVRSTCATTVWWRALLRCANAYTAIAAMTASPSRGADCDQAPLPPFVACPFLDESALRFEARAPREHRVREDVVEDLVARCGGTVRRAGAHDPLGGQPLQYLGGLVLFDGCVAGEIAYAVRDLRSRGRDEEVVHRSRRALFAERQLRHRPLEMVLDDVLRPAELVQRRETERARAALGLDLPETGEHELEVGRLDAALVSASGRDSATRDAELDATRGHLIEDRILELELDLDAVGRLDELVITGDGPDDRSHSRGSIETLESQAVRQEIRNRRFERIEPRERVLAHADQDVDPETRTPEDLCKLFGEDAAAAVVEEALLELVEDQVEIAACTIRRVCKRVHERVSVPAHRFDQRRRRLARPGREDDDFGLLLPTKSVRHAGAQDGALADSARPVQDGDPRGDEIGGDHLALALAPEKEERVEIGVFERSEPLERGERRCGDDAHTTACK